MRLGPERQAVLRLGGSCHVLRVVERPLVERDHRLPGCLDDLLAELDRLGQNDLLLGGQEGDPADLPEVHPERVVHAEHVGRERLGLLGGRLAGLPSRGYLQLLGRRLLELLVVERGGGIERRSSPRLGPILVDYLEAGDDPVRGRRREGGIDVGRRIRGSERDRAAARRATTEGPGAGDLNLGERPRPSAQTPLL